MFKTKHGFTGIDILLAIVVIILFTTVIASLMYNIKYENLKIKNKLISNIYLIETLENIGIASYDSITSDNLSVFPEDMPNSLQKSIEVTETHKDIIKKVKVTISYNIEDRTYENIVERLKIKD